MTEHDLDTIERELLASRTLYPQHEFVHANLQAARIDVVLRLVRLARAKVQEPA